MKSLTRNLRIWISENFLTPFTDGTKRLKRALKKRSTGVFKWKEPHCLATCITSTHQPNSNSNLLKVSVGSEEPTLSVWVSSWNIRASMAAATRLLAAVMAWMSPVRWRLNYNRVEATSVLKLLCTFPTVNLSQPNLSLWESQWKTDGSRASGQTPNSPGEQMTACPQKDLWPSPRDLANNHKCHTTGINSDTGLERTLMCFRQWARSTLELHSCMLLPLLWLLLWIHCMLVFPSLVPHLITCLTLFPLKARLWSPCHIKKVRCLEVYKLRCFYSKYCFCWANESFVY